MHNVLPRKFALKVFVVVIHVVAVCQTISSILS